MPDPSLRIECGTFYLAAGQIEEALGLLAPGAGDCETPAPFETPEARYYRACALAAAGCTDEAIQLYQAVLAGCGPQSPPALSYPEAKPVYWGAVTALDRLTAGNAWYPSVVQPTGDGEAGDGCAISEPVLAQWQWCDPFQDGACHIEHGATPAANPAVELVAADGRDLWYINTGAPSLRTDVAADFALEARCGASARRPLAMGGLMLWCDGSNYVRLDWGGLGAGEISFLGWAGGKRRFWGRVRSGCAQPILRLERRGQEVRALFSEDGRRWFLVGKTTLAVDGPWLAGLVGLGMVDRILFPGAPAGGAAIRFDLIKFWRA